MAKLEKKVTGDIYDVAERITSAVMNGSVSASVEETSDFSDGTSRCVVRVFERYSWFGGNRVSMSVTLFQNGSGPVYVSACTSGGSQAMFFKINTIGEENFLDTIRDVLS